MPCQAMSSEENGCKEKAQWGIRRIKLGISAAKEKNADFLLWDSPIRKVFGDNISAGRIG